MRAAFIALAIALSSTSAVAAPTDMLTIDGGVVCERPWKLSEAIVASNRGDSAWVRELGCITLPGGLKAIKIDPLAPLSSPWKVRLFGPTGAITVWGYAPSFSDLKGKKLWPH